MSWGKVRIRKAQGDLIHVRPYHQSSLSEQLTRKRLGGSWACSAELMQIFQECLAQAGPGELEKLHEGLTCRMQFKGEKSRRPTTIQANFC